MVGKIEDLFSVLVVWSVSYAWEAWSARGHLIIQLLWANDRLLLALSTKRMSYPLGK